MKGEAQPLIKVLTYYFLFNFHYYFHFNFRKLNYDIFASSNMEINKTEVNAHFYLIA